MSSRASFSFSKTEKVIRNSSSGLGVKVGNNAPNVCDNCRRKKMQCDGGRVPERTCSKCISSKVICTYTDVNKKRTSRRYVENLEARLEKISGLLKLLRPDVDLDRELNNLVEERSEYGRQKDRAEIKGKQPESPQSKSPLRRLAARTTPDPFLIPTIKTRRSISDDEDESVESQKPLASNKIDDFFEGKKTGVYLFRNLLSLKMEVLGIKETKDYSMHRRDRFWSDFPWEKISKEEGEIRYKFPPDDLLSRLIDTFFSHVNLFLPLFHRPSFERDVQNQVHRSDFGFGSVVLLVCAIGAKWYGDSRIRVESCSRGSYGWYYFEQVQSTYKPVFSAPSLHDLQYYALSAFYLHSTSFPDASWNLLGAGIRLAQDVGVHRKRNYPAFPTVESEQWKRTFWILVVLDTVASAAQGRPCAIQEEHYDLDIPIECDDEYWGSPDQKFAFKQPEGKPSRVTFFVSFLKLTLIQALALRTLYSSDELRNILGFVGPTWQQKVVTQLDTNLKKWFDSIPDHLRWDLRRGNDLFLHQSAILYSRYYQLQILIHRPFVTNLCNTSAIADRSRTICVDAAISCAHVANSLLARGRHVLWYCHVPIFEAAIVLLLHVWSAKASGKDIDYEKHIEDVMKCMQVMTMLEERVQSAGKFWDILNELMQIKDPFGSSNSPTSETAGDSSRTNAFESSREKAFPFPNDNTSPTLSNQVNIQSGFINLSGATIVQSRRVVPSHSSLPVGIAKDSELPSERWQQSTDSSMHGTKQSNRLPVPSQSFRGTFFDPVHSSSNSAAPPIQSQLSSREQPGEHHDSSSESAVPSTVPQIEVAGYDTSSSSSQGESDIADFTGLEMWPATPLSYSFNEWGTYIHKLNLRSSHSSSRGGPPGPA